MTVRLSGAVAAMLLFAGTFGPTTAVAEPLEPNCVDPAAGVPFERRSAADVGMDAAAVADTIDFGMYTGASTVQIYRHGCLVGDRSEFGHLPLPLASGTKGVAAVAVGRAVTEGYFDLDDTLGTFFPQADSAHAALTVRQILNQTTGLRFAWPSDGAGLVTDQVSQMLNAPVDFEPGTTFQYAQNAPALVAAIIEITTGSDFLDYVQRELFGPIGIARENWVWVRDRSGHVAVNGGLAMRPADLARIGQLLVRDGRWMGRQLVDSQFIREGAIGTEANGGYGFLWWTNAGDTYRGVNVPTPVQFDHPVWVGSPRDMFTFSGALGQFLVVVPSRDMVIVRLGGPPRIDPGSITGMLTGTTNPDFKELFRRATAAVTDMPQEPYEDPYRYPAPNEPLVQSPEDLEKLADPANTVAILLGTGPYAATDCNLADCHGNSVVADVNRFVADVAGQVAAAAVAAGQPRAAGR